VLTRTALPELTGRTRCQEASGLPCGPTAALLAGGQGHVCAGGQLVSVQSVGSGARCVPDRTVIRGKTMIHFGQAISSLAGRGPGQARGSSSGSPVPVSERACRTPGHERLLRIMLTSEPHARSAATWRAFRQVGRRHSATAAEVRARVTPAASRPAPCHRSRVRGSPAGTGRSRRPGRHERPVPGRQVMPQAAEHQGQRNHRQQTARSAEHKPHNPHLPATSQVRTDARAVPASPAVPPAHPHPRSSRNHGLP
jgi:hypothetical protein